MQKCIVASSQIVVAQFDVVEILCTNRRIFLFRLNRKLKEFTSIFSELFFLQMATSSICICGMVYSLAFVIFLFHLKIFNSFSKAKFPSLRRARTKTWLRMESIL